MVPRASRTTALRPLDAVWLRMETPTNPMQVTAVLRLGGPVEPARLRALIAERVVRAWPRFRDRLVRGARPHWEPTEVDLHHHVVEATPDGTLDDLVGALMSVALPPDRPPWQVHLVTIDGRTALVWRIHHCIADGIALARILLSLVDDPPAPIEPRGARALRTGTWSQIAALGRRGVRGVGAAAHLLLMPPDPPSPLLGTPGPARLARRMAPVPLDDVRRIGRTFGVTVNDVLLAALAGGLHRWLRHRGADVDHVRAMIPVNLRPLHRPLPQALGNRFSVVFVPLPVGVRDPVVRLRAIHTHTARLRDGAEALVGYALLEAAGAAPPAAERAALSLFGHKASLIGSNVPGPTSVVHLAGAPVDSVLFWTAHAGDVALSVSMFSYAGEVTVGFAVDADRIPDVDRIVDGLREDLDDLFAEAR